MILEPVISVGKLVANLYFVLMDLPTIVSTYLFSLDSYIALFKKLYPKKKKERNNKNRIDV